MNERWYVFKPRKDGNGFTTHGFDTEKEAKHFFNMHPGSYIKKLPC